MNDSFIDFSGPGSPVDNDTFKHQQCLDASTDHATRCGYSTSSALALGHPDIFELLPLATAGSAENQLWETIRRAEASFDKHGRASRRFHKAKWCVDQTLRWLTDAEPHPRPSSCPNSSFVGEERRLASDDEEDLAPSAQAAVPLDADRGNSFSSSCPAREARLKAGEAQIALIIDAMEARVARVEQLADEMERLLFDTQNLLYRMTQCIDSNPRRPHGHLTY